MTYSVDIFSMGCVYYYVLTKGGHPFGDASPASRPPLEAVLSHPIFWSNEKILNFFQDVSDRIEKESESSFPVLRRFEIDAKEIVMTDWRDHICTHVAMDLRKYRTYKGESIRDLLRALRNKKNHYRELTIEAQESLGHIPNEFVNYWISRFPSLLPYTWVMFECLKQEHVFRGYFAPDYDFYDVLRGDDPINMDEYLALNKPLDQKESPKLDKEFWKSKSQAKYQKWRSSRGRGYARGHVPREPQQELSASTDNYWRNSSPSPGREDTQET
ncbi:Serine/threonine-protein kinase/endoribonuclease IRE1 [Orchesella cincta]|uniref:Serine/threonine-protein kinase/endoribonuclease IRE1 n=1 Tax=Orchesella cincta TaxID=48709 RepID=A0A1D2N8K4_ORCCI|nr:Serine/threonine-protein kinase/endoribonuclease IRE1 [Orchesella cincta]